MNTGSCCRTLIAHEGPVWALVRHENILVSASQDRTVGVRQREREEALRNIERERERDSQYIWRSKTRKWVQGRQKREDVCNNY